MLDRHSHNKCDGTGKKRLVLRACSGIPRGPSQRRRLSIRLLPRKTSHDHSSSSTVPLTKFTKRLFCCHEEGDMFWFERSGDTTKSTTRVKTGPTTYENEKLCNEGRRSHRRDGTNTEMNKARADHIRKLPTTIPRCAGNTGVRPDTIPMIDDDSGEKDRANNSCSSVATDCI